MPRGRPVVPVSLSVEEKNQLLSIARSRSLPHGVVQTGTDRAGLFRRQVQHRHCQAHGTEQHHGRQVAPPLPRARPGRPARRTASRAAPNPRGRARRRSDQHGPADQAARCHAVERAQHGPTYRHLQNHRATLVRSVRRTTAPPTPLQTVHRSVLHRESARHCRAVPQSARPCRGVVCGRKDPDPGASAHPTDAADGTWKVVLVRWTVRGAD